MRFCLLETLSGQPISPDVELEITSRKTSWGKPDELKGNILKEHFFGLNPRPVATSIAVFEEKYGQEVVTYAGIITRISHTHASEVVTFESKSMLYYPHLVAENDEIAWEQTDGGVILSHLWCRAFTPNELSPQWVTYRPVKTGILLGEKGDPTTEKKPAPVRSAWYTGDVLGTVAQGVTEKSKIVHEEIYEENFMGTPFVSITARHKPQPIDSGCVFSISQNIAQDVLFDTKASDVASDVLVLGKGTGPSRLRGQAQSGEEKMPRTSVVLKDETNYITADSTRIAAQQRANFRKRKLPFSKVKVLKDSAFAPENNYSAGVLVKIDLGDIGGVFENILIESIEFGNELDETCTLYVRQFEGWN